MSKGLEREVEVHVLLRGRVCLDSDACVDAGGTRLWHMRLSCRGRCSVGKREVRQGRVFYCWGEYLEA